MQFEIKLSVVNGGGNRSTQRNPLSNHRAQAIYSHASFRKDAIKWVSFSHLQIGMDTFKNETVRYRYRYKLKRYGNVNTTVNGILLHNYLIIFVMNSHVLKLVQDPGQSLMNDNSG